MKSILSLFGGKRPRFKKPEDKLQFCIRELNEKIPELNAGIVQLKEQISRREAELDTLISREKRILKRIQSEKGNNGGESPEAFTRDLKTIHDAIDTVNGDLEEMKYTRLRAVDTLKGFLFSKKSEIEEALSLLQEKSRREWHGKCDVILKKCLHLWESEAAGVKNGRYPGGAYAAHLRERIAGGAAKIDEIAEIAPSIRDDSIREKVGDIVRTSRRMLDYLGENPSEITNARMFLLYYLDAVVEVIEGYVKLSDHDLRSEKVSASLKRAESLIAEIRGAFIALHEKMLEYEVLNFDAEMSVLEKTLRS